MAFRDAYFKPTIYSAGKQTNPQTTTLMADTGAIGTAGWFQVRVVLGASAAAIFQVQRRNVANDGNVGAVPVIYIPAASSGEYVFDYEVTAGERIRVMMDTNLTGTAAATLQIEEVT